MYLLHKAQMHLYVYEVLVETSSNYENTLYTFNYTEQLQAQNPIYNQCPNLHMYVPYMLTIEIKD